MCEKLDQYLFFPRASADNYPSYHFWSGIDLALLEFSPTWLLQSYYHNMRKAFEKDPVGFLREKLLFVFHFEVVFRKYCVISGCIILNMVFLLIMLSVSIWIFDVSYLWFLILYYVI